MFRIGTEARLKLLRDAIASLAVLLLATPAFGQEPSEKDWQVEVTPYLWFAGEHGKNRLGTLAPVQDIDRSIGDMFDNLEAAAYVSGNVRVGRFVALADINYAVTEDKLDSPRLFPPPLYGRERIARITGTVAAGWELFENDRVTLDAFGGVRYTRVETVSKLRFNGVFAGRFSKTIDFADPIVGARANVALTDRISLNAYGDIGGFHVSSNLTAQAMATVEYHVTDHLSLLAGYRYLTIDFEDGDTLLDVDVSGPLVGATFRF